MFWDRWFGFLGSPDEGDCYLVVPVESQTTGPQTTMIYIYSWYIYIYVNIPGTLTRGPLLFQFRPCFGLTFKEGHQTMGSRYIFLCLKKAGFQVGTLPETNMAPEKKSWKRRFLLETIIFRCYVSFRECIPLVLYFTRSRKAKVWGVWDQPKSLARRWRWHPTSDPQPLRHFQSVGQGAAEDRHLGRNQHPGSLLYYRGLCYPITRGL